MGCLHLKVDIKKINKILDDNNNTDLIINKEGDFSIIGDTQIQ